ncbi:BTB And Kelch [Cooperia oncophora]
MKIGDVSVLSILPAANLLQFTEVQELCCEFLEEELDISSCLGIRALAETYACRKLLQCADKYILRNFQEVVGLDEFNLLPIKQLLELISNEELQVRSEEQVFAAVTQNGIEIDLQTRKQFLSKNYHLLDAYRHERLNMQGHRFRPRKVFSGEVLYAGNVVASVERLDPAEVNPVWKQVGSMSKRRFTISLEQIPFCLNEISRNGAGVVVLDKLLYVVGGSDGEAYRSSCERY